MVANHFLGTRDVVLASASPRRHDLLRGLGITVRVCPSLIDENCVPLNSTHLSEQVVELALAKGKPVSRLNPDSLVIAADTMVGLAKDDNGTWLALGKPKDADNAKRMLAQLQGRAHEVWTGVAVFYQGCYFTGQMKTSVWMASLSDEAQWAYIKTGEPLDKAGAYAIQGVGSTLIDRIEGCYFNVVGLPLNLLMQLISELVLVSSG